MWHFPEFDIDGEIGDGVLQSVDAVAVGLPYEMGVDDVNGGLRVEVRDDGVCFDNLPANQFHARGPRVVAQDALGLAAGADLPTEAADGIRQGLCNTVAAAHDAPGTLNVEVVDECVDIGRRLVTHARVKGQIARQHVPQGPVVRDRGDEVVDARLDVVRLDEDVLLHFS